MTEPIEELKEEVEITGTRYDIRLADGTSITQHIVDGEDSAFTHGADYAKFVGGKSKVTTRIYWRHVAVLAERPFRRTVKVKKETKA